MKVQAFWFLFAIQKERSSTSSQSTKESSEKTNAAVVAESTDLSAC